MKKIIFTLFIIVTLISCNSHVVYDKYNHTPIAGWEKNDTLTFDVPKVVAAGEYYPSLGLRINGAYPFMGLTLIIEQRILPENKVLTDTLQCDLISKSGTAKGQGISYYQYKFPIKSTYLNKGDSLHISVRHDMKREILPGISDIGFQLRAN